MNKKWLASLTIGGLLVAAGSVAVYGQQARAAWTPSPSPARDAASVAGAGNDVRNQQETSESQALQAQAKISPQAAATAALKTTSGAVKQVSLDNENGHVVYSVEIRTSTGTTDVKVDAANGRIVAKDQNNGTDNANEMNQSETGNARSEQ